MIKYKSYKKYIALIFIVAFTFPVIIKATHFLYHHHEHYNPTCNHSHKQDVGKKHEKCLICEFEFTEFVEKTDKINISNPEYFTEIKRVFRLNIFIVSPAYSFLLRAPPVNNSIF